MNKSKIQKGNKIKIDVLSIRKNNKCQNNNIGLMICNKKKNRKKLTNE